MATEEPKILNTSAVPSVEPAKLTPAPSSVTPVSAATFVPAYNALKQETVPSFENWLNKTFFDNGSFRVDTLLVTGGLIIGGFLAGTAFLGESLLAGIVGIGAMLGLGALISGPGMNLFNGVSQNTPSGSTTPTPSSPTFIAQAFGQTAQDALDQTIKDTPQGVKSAYKAIVNPPNEEREIQHMVGAGLIGAVGTKTLGYYGLSLLGLPASMAIPVAIGVVGTAHVIGWRTEKRKWEEHPFIPTLLDNTKPPKLTDYRHVDGLTRQLFNLDYNLIDGEHRNNPDPELCKLGANYSGRQDAKYKDSMLKAGVILDPDGSGWFDSSIFLFHPEKLRAILVERRQDVEVLYQADVAKERSSFPGWSWAHDNIGLGFFRQTNNPGVEDRVRKRGRVNTGTHNSIHDLDLAIQECDNMCKHIDLWKNSLSGVAKQHYEIMREHCEFESQNRGKQYVENQAPANIQIYNRYFQGQLRDEGYLQNLFGDQAAGHAKLDDVRLIQAVSKKLGGNIDADKAQALKDLLDKGSYLQKDNIGKVTDIGNKLKSMTGGAVQVASAQMQTVKATRPAGEPAPTNTIS